MIFSMTTRELRIASRFCGPPESGNGGYSSGLLAGLLGSSVEVTLRKPPPLERTLLAELTGEHAVLSVEGDLVAEARANDNLAIGIVPSDGGDAVYGRLVSVSPRNDLALVATTSPMRLPPLTIAGNAPTDSGSVTAAGSGAADPPRPRTNFDALSSLMASRRPTFITDSSSAVSVPGPPRDAQ